jgi:hypothetical protein
MSIQSLEERQDLLVRDRQGWDGRNGAVRILAFASGLGGIPRRRGITRQDT